MYELTREENSKPVPFKWMLTKQKAFKTIKVKLVTVLVVVYPDFNKLFILYTDASNGGIRVILHQKCEDERERIIIYASRIFNEHEKKYPIMKQECLAVI